MDFLERVIKDVRLTILQLLEQDNDYSHNENIIQMGLSSVGHSLSIDRIRTEIRWLEEQGLLTVEDLAGLLVAKLNRRGQDVALGRSKVDGIARPRP